MTGKALVSGAGKRLGRAMALYLGARGFDVAVHYNSSREAAEEVSADIRAALIEPIFAADRVIEVDVSIGCATTGDSPTAARLLATADDAMYAVKRNRTSSR